jgi:xanthine dehydrogenase YagS FAD-binding subunit
MMKDMMAGFELFQPADVETALELLDRHGAASWRLAGGYDSLDWLKNRSKQTRAVIDLEGLDELRGIRENAGGLEIGALTTLTEIETSPLVRERYGLLADAARKVASPQIRNAGTIGGNLCQDTRCWYYRYGVKCYRAGGNTCYAAAPEAMNREHAIFEASRCVAVTPSDCAPAVVALDAEMVVRSRGGERVIRAADFFVSPAIDIRRMTVLEPEELLVAVRLPAAWSGASFYFEKVADRNVWDFPLVNVAAAFRMNGDAVADARIVCGAVQCTPRRATAAERLVVGRSRTDPVAEAAAAAAVAGAEPLGFNAYKVPLMQSLVRRAVRGA